MKISLRTWDGRHYLCAEPDGRVVADRTQVGAWEEWTLINLGGDTYTLQSHHGRYLCAELDGNVIANRVDAGPWESWRLVQAGDGVAFVSHHGLYLCAEGGGGGEVVADRTSAGVWETFFPSQPVGGSPDQPGPGVVRQIQSQVRVINRSFGDASGPRILHGCSDFGAIRRFKEDPSGTLRGLDVMAQYQQYVRVLWRLNGKPWDLEWPGPGGWPMTVDPIVHPWFEEALRGYLQACWDRGIRVNLTTGDMFNWATDQAEEWFRRVAQIATSISPDLVWLSAAVNEMRGTMPGGESDEGIAKLEHLMRVWKQYYPWGMRSISDPGSQDKAGMQRLSGGNSTCALIHDVRWGVPDALRRCFNSAYENYPNKPIVQDEPTGPNGSVPPPFGQRVYQPVNDEDDLLAIYTIQVVTGQASTYFGDSSLIDRQPLEANWGFKEIPAFWRQMAIPEDIGQGQLYHGGRSESAMNVIGSNADRADCCVHGNVAFGVISGEHGGWKVKSRWDAQLTAWTAKGVVRDERVSVGQVLPISGPTPTVVRFVR